MKNSLRNCRKKFEDKGFKSYPMTEARRVEKAVLRAKSMGYPIPRNIGGCLAFILMIIGLFTFVVPVILILLWVWYQGNQYERNMRQLLAIRVLRIYFLRKIIKFSASSAFVKPYAPSVNRPSYKRPETLFTSL